MKIPPQLSSLIESTKLNLLKIMDFVKRKKKKIILFSTLGLGLIIVACGAMMWIEGMPPFDREVIHERPSIPPKNGMALTRIHRAIPDGSSFILGINGLQKTVQSYRSSEFFKAFEIFKASITAGGMSKKFKRFKKKRPAQPGLSEWTEAAHHLDQIVLSLYTMEKSTQTLPYLILLSVPEKSPGIPKLKKFAALLNKELHRKPSKRIRYRRRAMPFPVNPVQMLSKKILPSMQSKPHVFFEKNILGLSNKKELADHAQKVILNKEKPGSNLLTKTQGRIPQQSTLYYAMDLDRLKMYQSIKKAGNQNDYLKSFPWTAGGSYFKSGLWTEYWSEIRPNVTLDHLIRQAPRPGTLPANLAVDDAIIRVSLHSPVNILYELLRESLSKKPGFLHFSAMLKTQNKDAFSWFEKIMPHLGDEIHIFAKGFTTSSFFPSIVSAVKIKNKWRSELILRRNLTEENGWKKKDKIYYQKIQMANVDIGVARNGDFLFFGTKSLIQNLMARKSSESKERLPKVLETLKTPEAVTSILHIDFSKLFYTLSKKFLPRYLTRMDDENKSKFQQEMKKLFDFIPPFANYSVNAQKGVFSKHLFLFRNRPESEWKSFFDGATRVIRMAKRTAATQIRQPPATAQKRKKPISLPQRMNETQTLPKNPQTNLPLEERRPDPFEPLHQLLRNGSLREREETAIALGEVGDKRDIPHLRRLLRDEDSILRQIARDAIRKIRKR